MRGGPGKRVVLGVHRAVVAAALTLIAPGTDATGLGAQARETRPDTVVFAVDAAYGTLAFRGTVERVDVGDAYEYRPHIAITFRPNERPNQTNQTPIANLTMCVLSATIREEGNERPTVLSRQTEAITVLLSEYNETKLMPEVTFRLPMSIAAQAGHVLIGVTDGRLMWPIPVDLR